MKQFAIELTEAALVEITALAQFIAFDQQQPENAGPWLRDVWEAVDSLVQFPRRCSLAKENESVAYEVR